MTAAAPAGAAAGGQRGQPEAQQAVNSASRDPTSSSRSETVARIFRRQMELQIPGTRGLWAAPRQGTVTISKKADGKSPMPQFREPTTRRLQRDLDDHLR
ncbi:MAG: hypothetical protein IPJ07_01765 [Acidobacteria bacterium]|nr:hypothetical protein [Acidobacteriota bacterium]